MSTSRNSFKPSNPGRKTRRTNPDPDAPFSSETLARARQVATGYRFIIRPSESLGFVGRTLEMPLVLGSGKTPEECLKRTMFAVETTVATLLERGEAPPAAGLKRTEQINIRLTSEEKLILEEESERRGFRGLSDFVRAAVLAEASGTGSLKR